MRLATEPAPRYWTDAHPAIIKFHAARVNGDSNFNLENVLAQRNGG
jgi:hypothetical protein